MAKNFRKLYNSVVGWITKFAVEGNLMNAEPNVERMFIKRGRLDVIHSILAAVRRDNPGALKTHILYKSNLSHSLLNRYLDFLVQNEMVKTRKIRKKLVYEITDKGREFLRAYEDLRTIIEGRS